MDYTTRQKAILWQLRSYPLAYKRKTKIDTLTKHELTEHASKYNHAIKYPKNYEKPQEFNSKDVINFIHSFYKPSTKNIYLYAFMKMKKPFTSQELQSKKFQDMLKSHEDTRLINSFLSPISKYIQITYKKNEYPKLRSFLKELITHTNNVHKLKTQERNSQTSVKTTPDMFEKKYLELKDILLSGKTENQYKLTEKGLLDAAIILCVYSRVALRDDLGKVFIDTENSQNNSYDTKTGILKINQYKTSGKYGSLEIDLGKERRDFINHTLKLYPRKLLIETESDGERPKLSKRFSYFTTKIFGKRISINDYRHAFSTYISNQSIENRIDTAREMGHSIDTQIIHYIQQPNQTSQ